MSEPLLRAPVVTLGTGTGTQVTRASDGTKTKQKISLSPHQLELDSVLLVLGKLLIL